MLSEELFHRRKSLKRTQEQLDGELLLALRLIIHREGVETWARRLNYSTESVRGLLLSDCCLTDREWAVAERYFRQIEQAKLYEQNGRRGVDVRFPAGGQRHE